MTLLPIETDPVEQWLAETLPSEFLLAPLPDTLAEQVVKRLKDEADRYWYIDPHHSVKLAERIISIGKIQDNPLQIALGLMAKGDALKFLGETAEAWDALDQAGNIFQAAGDEIGWARTRIGRLYLSTMLNRVELALTDAENARTIFKRHGQQEKLLRLDVNTALVHTLLGDQIQALRLYHSALAIAEILGSLGKQYLGLLFMNIGLAHESLGDFSQALSYYQRAREIYIERSETLNIAVIELNIAYIAQAQGHYRHALNLLYKIRDGGVQQFPIEYRAVQRDIIECYLSLNRYADARDLAQQLIIDYKNSGATHDTARNLLHLAIAEAGLGNFSVAESALEEAEPIFSSLGATGWVATSQLRQGELALKQGDFLHAHALAKLSAEYFSQNGQQTNYATAILLRGQVEILAGNLEAARRDAGIALKLAQHFNVPSLLYRAHLLLGEIAERQGLTKRAARRYQVAISTVERMQRELTITLRTGFLDDKGEAARRLISLYLQQGQNRQALDTLERVKSQVLLDYLANREQLRWKNQTTGNVILIQELNTLRSEHQWFYRLAHEPPHTEHPSTIQPDQALYEVAVREQRIRAITEQLYLNTEQQQNVFDFSVVSSESVQAHIKPDTALVEYYNDGQSLWAFTIYERELLVCKLGASAEAIKQLSRQLQMSMSAALSIAPQNGNARRLLQSTQLILQRLHAELIEPLKLSSQNLSKLLIVPYGVLHYLPFHLFYDSKTYLFEHYETVTLPTSGLITRPAVKRTPGALILANDAHGKLPSVYAEAQKVQNLFGGAVFSGSETKQSVLERQPTQILHIASHGEHRLDHPDLSYLELAEGHVYADDMLQHDLSYELVTLSACETGRANVSSSDELIGLGRGFLYAGAGALISSMWQVPDSLTVEFMETLYRALKQGSSKSGAMRIALQAMRTDPRELHPAYWGAFQLIGDDRPLSRQEQ